MFEASKTGFRAVHAQDRETWPELTTPEQAFIEDLKQLHGAKAAPDLLGALHASLVTVRLALARLRRQPAHELLDEPSWASTLAVVDSADAGRLQSRERALLHLYLVGEMTLDKLGAVYGVRVATACRWLAAAREHLAEQIKQALKASLAIDSREVKSIERLVHSQLDLSLGELFLRD